MKSKQTYEAVWYNFLQKRVGVTWEDSGDTLNQPTPVQNILRLQIIINTTQERIVYSWCRVFHTYLLVG